MRPRDTSVDAYAAQIAAVRAVGGAERVRIAVELSEQLRRMMAEVVRRRHPDWAPERVRREVLTRIYGADLVERAWGALAGE